MERRFHVRLRELVEDAVVAPEVFAGCRESSGLSSRSRRPWCGASSDGM